MKLSISRGDYLTLRIMLALFVASPLVTPFWHAWEWIKGAPLVWLNGGSTPQAIAGEAVSPLETATGLTVRPSLETLSWEFTDPAWTQRVGAMLPGLLVAVVTLWLCVTVWRFTLLVQRGRAFSAGAHRLLVQFGIGLVFLTAALLVGEAVANMLIYSSSPDTGMGFAMLTISAGDIVPLGAAMVVLVVAHAWRQGEQLAEDAEATI
ncbi:MAG: DUF2975 domain-containing protein [Propionibacteriaceae bacterium]|nr:DUF2975 domain-containing protein [Propionibacteriaceae bacterium]